ncbi:hypothetical protein AB0O34_06205 [Sphaerisporangium sp. NPDC088356]|uniref:hypothetical protein n=1 Tax=Sphaerisporangium sp. NPDC088356 TaxID=3154871 RepID=UPI003431BFA1
MAVEFAQILSREVVTGVATMDMSTEEGTISARMVVQDITGIDRETGQDRRLLIIFDPDGVEAMADALRQAAAKAKTPES